MLLAPVDAAQAQVDVVHSGWQTVAVVASPLWADDARHGGEAAVELTMSVFPNPVLREAVVRFTIERTQLVTLDVFDLLGRRVMQRELGVLETGEHEVQLDLQRLPTGLYIVRLTGDAGARATVRITKAASA